ncbi:TetR/AcrR family transcriptional regulator [Nocardia pseudovaccinii]|uniref:TetR/AcrR family transcriptional regulator n=1 Tax=Nocardia pseudovaccinii TaxID=189540 RepID=UPI0007A42945|nr:TetR/AcrR family transcriptional regulator [Nocardia pseudovaccinii]
MPDTLVQAALEAARALGRDVADVPLIEVARTAKISKSTLLRRLGGTREALDAAVRDIGVALGGRAPVRERATTAAAQLIDERGLSAVTLEAVAARAECSVHSLYAGFGGRDEMLRAAFDRFGPVLDLTDATADEHATFEVTVHRIYRVITETFSKRPRVMPAMLAEMMARPTDRTVSTLIQHTGPRMLASLGGWLSDQIASGNIRDLPLPVLMQQMIAPVILHACLRPAAGSAGFDLPDPEESCAIFADAFLLGVSTTRPGQRTR